MTFHKKAFTAGMTGLCLAGLGLAGATAHAGPLVEAATKAEALAAGGNAGGARDLIRDAVGTFSATLPFGIAKAAFVASEPAGYAMYEPRPAPTFKIGEQIVSYIEPVGLTWKPSGTQGKLETHFTVDFEILDTKGAVLASQKSFGSFTFTGFTRNQEIYATLSIDVSGAPAGDYVLRFHFNDVNGSRTASVDQPLSIVAQTP